VLRAVDKADKFDMVGSGKASWAGRRTKAAILQKGAGLDAAQIEAIGQALRFNIEIEQMPDGAWREHIDGNCQSNLLGWKARSHEARIVRTR